jgi:protein tyrosine/serine phosphatase
MRVALALLGSLLLAGCGVTMVVDRAADGTPILVRSPQPDEDDLRALAEEHGVRTVVNLRGEPDPETGWFQEERRGVEAIGARWVQLRVSGGAAPEPATVGAFCDLIEDPANWPVLVHCQGGVHRTGLLGALYRIQYQGWSAEAAVAEMEDLWFDWTTRDRDALKRWLRAYRPDPARRVPRERPAGRAPLGPPP